MILNMMCDSNRIESSQCPDGNPHGIVNTLDWQRRQHYDLIFTGLDGHFPDINGNGFPVPTESITLIPPSASEQINPICAQDIAHSNTAHHRDDAKSESDADIDLPDTVHAVESPNNALSQQSQGSSTAPQPRDDCSVATGLISAVTTTVYFRRYLLSPSFRPRGVALGIKPQESSSSMHIA